MILSYNISEKILDESNTEYIMLSTNIISTIQTSTDYKFPKFHGFRYNIEPSIICSMERSWSFSHETLHAHKSCDTAPLELQEIVADARKNYENHVWVQYKI